MNKIEIIELLNEKYNSFNTYIKKLSSEDFLYRFEKKWNAEKQIEHIILCIKPLIQVFSMDKIVIEQNFGKTERESLSYEILKNVYIEKLNNGAKAPERFVPESNNLNNQNQLIETLTKIVAELCNKIETFSETELNYLCIPHPLLGNLTLKEMLYNAIYHVEHHKNQAIENLKHK